MNNKLLYSEKWRWRWGKEKENDHEVVQKKKGRLKIRGWPASYLTWGKIDINYDFINSCLIEKNTLWNLFFLLKRFARISFHNAKTEKISLAIFIKEKEESFFFSYSGLAKNVLSVSGSLHPTKHIKMRVSEFISNYFISNYFFLSLVKWETDIL